MSLTRLEAQQIVVARFTNSSRSLDHPKALGELRAATASTCLERHGVEGVNMAVTHREGISSRFRAGYNDRHSQALVGANALACEHSALAALRGSTGGGAP